MCPTCDGAGAYQRGWYGGFYICGRCNGLGRVTETAWQRWAHPPPPPRWTVRAVPKGCDAADGFTVSRLTRAQVPGWLEFFSPTSWDVTVTRDAPLHRGPPGKPHDTVT